MWDETNCKKSNYEIWRQLYMHHTRIERFIKGDNTRHLSPNLFYTPDLHKKGKIDVQQIQSSYNLVDLFTKSLPAQRYQDLVYIIGIHNLHDMCWIGRSITRTALFFFFRLSFYLAGFFLIRILTRRLVLMSIDDYSRGSI